MWTDESKDRFGDLPDSAVFDILSYMKTKEAVQTCILSKRWNNLTNNLPIITLDCDQFKSLDSFERALSQILSVRNEFDDVLDTLDLALTEFDSYDDFPQSTDEVFKRMVSLELCLTHPCSLKHLHIDAEQDYSALLLTWLQGFPSITSLTLSSNTLQLLSLVPGLFKVKLTSLYNLESLQVQMKPLSSQLYTILCCGEFMIPGVEPYQATIIPDGVVDCLIQNSPSANVTFIPYNKIQDPREVRMKDPRRRRRRRGRKAKQI